MKSPMGIAESENSALLRRRSAFGAPGLSNAASPAFLVSEMLGDRLTKGHFRRAVLIRRYRVVSARGCGERGGREAT
jgi:hypothetical protein